MRTITETLTTLNADAERIRNTDPQDVSNLEARDEWRQGDVRIIRLPAGFLAKHKAELEPVEAEAKLAPGNTQGSRHTLEHLRGVTMYRLKDATPLDGPIFDLAEPNAIPHPEHGHMVAVPVGCYAVTYQRSFGDELKRAQD